MPISSREMKILALQYWREWHTLEHFQTLPIETPLSSHRELACEIQQSSGSHVPILYCQRCSLPFKPFLQLLFNEINCEYSKSFETNTIPLSTISIRNLIYHWNLFWIMEYVTLSAHIEHIEWLLGTMLSHDHTLYTKVLTSRGVKSCNFSLKESISAISSTPSLV